MCRSIKPLHNFEPPATDDEIRSAALHFVRKVSGSTRPSKTNEPAFNQAVDRVAGAAKDLLRSQMRSEGHLTKLQDFQPEQFQASLNVFYRHRQMILDSINLARQG